MVDQPDESQLSRYFSILGRKGAKIRNERLSAKQRRQIAIKASKAAAEARQKKANQK